LNDSVHLLMVVPTLSKNVSTPAETSRDL